MYRSISFSLIEKCRSSFRLFCFVLNKIKFDFLMLIESVFAWNQLDNFFSSVCTISISKFTFNFGTLINTLFSDPSFVPLVLGGGGGGTIFETFLSHGRQPEVECSLFWRVFGPHSGRKKLLLDVCELS